MPSIIGVSSGRKGKASESLVRAILEGTGRDFELISLSGKVIQPCEACTGCVEGNRCLLKDDLQPTLDRLLEAEAIVFGAPKHYGRAHAKALAFWERVCFSGRHNSVFPLAGKLGVIAAVAGDGNGKPVIRDIQTYLQDARMDLVASISAQGEYACFSCGYGNRCPVGGFVELFPLDTPITREITPSLANQHPECPDLPPEERKIVERARRVGRVLVEVLATQKDKKDGFKGG